MNSFPSPCRHSIPLLNNVSFVCVCTLPSHVCLPTMTVMRIVPLLLPWTHPSSLHPTLYALSSSTPALTVCQCSGEILQWVLLQLFVCDVLHSTACVATYTWFWKLVCFTQFSHNYPLCTGFLIYMYVHAMSCVHFPLPLVFSPSCTRMYNHIARKFGGF